MNLTIFSCVALQLYSFQWENLLKLLCDWLRISMRIFLRILWSYMDDSSYRRNFDLDKKNEIHYHSWKEHLKMSEIALFVCELL
jgi:hypothetical protein